MSLPINNLPYIRQQVLHWLFSIFYPVDQKSLSTFLKYVPNHLVYHFLDLPQIRTFHLEKKSPMHLLSLEYFSLKKALINRRYFSLEKIIYKFLFANKIIPQNEIQYCLFFPPALQEQNHLPFKKRNQIADLNASNYHIFPDYFIYFQLSNVAFYHDFRWNQLDVGIVFLSVVGIVMEELESDLMPINPTIMRVMRVLRIARGTVHLHLKYRAHCYFTRLNLRKMGPFCQLISKSRLASHRFSQKNERTNFICLP